MKTIQPITGERHIELFWQGPYVLQNGELAIHAVEQIPLPKNSPGLYIALGDYPLKGPRSLLYIGKTDRLIQQRVSEHDWLSNEWRVEIYTANCNDLQLLADAEKLLIYAHTPLANSRNIQNMTLIAPLRIWNTGRFWALYPEVSSQHEWILGEWST